MTRSVANRPDCRCLHVCAVAAATMFLMFCLFDDSFGSSPAERTPAQSFTDTTVVLPPAARGDDDWFDLSSFMDQPYGFLPLVEPITEPAVGYGLWFGPMFISKPHGVQKAGWAMPNISYVGGMWTESNTWGTMAMDLRNWMDQRLQTAVAVLYASIKLDFHGIGSDAILKDNPIHYTLRPLLGAVRVKYRLGMSNFWVGLGYVYATTKIEMDIPDQFPRLQDIRRDSDIGGLVPVATYDSRDNVFTPTFGTVAEVSGMFCAKFLGGDAVFQKASAVIMQYVPLDPTLTLGVRGDGFFTFGDVPFYAYPYITLRGAAAMRYQGEEVAQGEMEMRWQFWKRLSLIGFVGYGVAWNDFEFLQNPVKVWTGGTGLRYELARRYGLHFGVDVAWSPDDFAIYLAFGSAWLRP